MHRTYKRRGIRRSPGRLGQRVAWFGIISQQVLDGTGQLLQRSGRIIQVHLIVPVPDFFWQATCPRLDLVQLVLLLVVPRFADIDLLVFGQAARSALVEAGYEHDETPIHHLVDTMIPVLAGFDNLVLVKVLLESMHGLFWAVVPAGIDTGLSSLVNVGTIDLGHNWFRQVIRVGDVHPVAYQITISWLDGVVA